MFYDHRGRLLCQLASSITIHSNSKVRLKRFQQNVLCVVFVGLFFPPTDQTVVDNCLTEFQAKTARRLKYLLTSCKPKAVKIVYHESIFLFPPLGPLLLKYSHGAVCVSLHKHLFGVRSSVSVCNRIQPREPPGICVHEHGRHYTVETEKEKKEKQFQDVTLFLYSHL